MYEQYAEEFNTGLRRALHSEQTCEKCGATVKIYPGYNCGPTAYPVSHWCRSWHCKKAAKSPGEGLQA